MKTVSVFSVVLVGCVALPSCLGHGDDTEDVETSDFERVSGLSNLTIQPVCGSGVNAWSATSSMANARSFHSSTLLNNGLVLVAGGYSTISGTPKFTATAELYNPTNGTWAAAGSMNVARAAHTATLLSNGKVFVTGGTTDTGDTSSTSLYDPTTNTWMDGPAMSTPRSEHTATLLANGKVLVTGGYGVTTKAAVVYDPATNAWAAAGSMSFERTAHTATLLSNGKVLIAGGSWPYYASAELYDPATNTWSSAGSMSSIRFAHTATWLPTLGKVLVAGGHNGGHEVASADLYNPATNTWSPTGSMSTPRYGHAAAAIACGKVLVSGGDGVSNAEIYNPATATWSDAGSMGTPRDAHTATWIPNIGKVLIAGGRSGSSTLATAQLYTP